MESGEGRSVDFHTLNLMARLFLGDDLAPEFYPLTLIPVVPAAEKTTGSEPRHPRLPRFLMCTRVGRVRLEMIG